MQISGLPQTKLASIATQYSIYAYDKYCSDVIGYNKWQCLLNSDNKEKALSEAQKLFETEKFQKIEVKKKVFDTKQQKHLVSTYRVFDGRSQQNLLLIAAFSMLAALSLVLLFLEVL